MAAEFAEQRKLDDVASGGDERALRARRETMAVRALGDGRYAVLTDHDRTYIVDPDAGRCSCPDDRYRDVRCKHRRRVAMSITSGEVPPPGYRARPCAVCDEPVFFDPGTDADGDTAVDTGAGTDAERDDEAITGSDRAVPVYCDAHTLSPGDRARDRETGTVVTVVGVSDRRSDETWIAAADATVADYPNNRSYAGSEPVVAAVYPAVAIGESGPVPDSLRVYCFPRSRLEMVGDDRDER